MVLSENLKEFSRLSKNPKDEFSKFDHIKNICKKDHYAPLKFFFKAFFNGLSANDFCGTNLLIMISTFQHLKWSRKISCCKSMAQKCQNVLENGKKAVSAKRFGRKNFQGKASHITKTTSSKQTKFWLDSEIYRTA